MREIPPTHVIEELMAEIETLRTRNAELHRELEVTTRIAQMRGNAAGEAEAQLPEAVELLKSPGNKDGKHKANYQVLSERVRMIRLSKRISQVEMATRCGISKSMMAQVESGVSHPSLDTLFSICCVLKISPEVLFAKEFTLRCP